MYLSASYACFSHDFSGLPQPLNPSFLSYPCELLSRGVHCGEHLGCEAFRRAIGTLSLRPFRLVGQRSQHQKRCLEMTLMLRLGHA